MTQTKKSLPVAGEVITVATDRIAQEAKLVKDEIAEVRRFLSAPEKIPVVRQLFFYFSGQQRFTDPQGSDDDLYHTLAALREWGCL
jgi:hypothetical protein